MNSYKKIVFVAILGLLVGGYLMITPALGAVDKSTLDSDEMSKLLSQAKTEALELKMDAEKMESFARTKLSWESHATAVELVKEHVNAVGRLVVKLNETRNTGSPWQQQAVDQITPLLKELASNTTATIEHLNNNKNRLHTPEYKEYLVMNYDLASELSALIVDFVDYGKTKAKFENLTNKLEMEHR